MPKIEVYEESFYSLLGRKLDQEELEDLLVYAKAELDEGMPEHGLLKIELNDTNRPDLWSTAGLARQLRYFLSGNAATAYDFFSDKHTLRDPGNLSVHVDPALRDIRPYITAFVAKGKTFNDILLIDIIQSQEKLCGNYGQNRKSIAMGVYRADLMSFPVQYQAADPESTRFVPLGLEQELNLRQILTEHPKGVEFGWIVADFQRFPYLVDSKGGTLSFPPIINSDRIGAVKEGDDEVFIELTGTNLDTLLLATSIAACDFADLGFQILPVEILYPYDTAYGRRLVTPFYFQKPQTVRVEYAHKLLGEEIEGGEVASLLRKAGHETSLRDGSLELKPPYYRNDFLHPVDIIEEIMIARGMDSFEPVMLEEFTIGRLSKIATLSRGARDIMVGLGFQEMIYNYLGSKRDLIERMHMGEADFIEIQNPMTENYAIVRNSILPNLLASESISANAVYPHRAFEIGKAAFKTPEDNYGTVTHTFLSFLAADREVGFNDVGSHVSALFYYLAREYSLEEARDPRFIPGRTAEIFHENRVVGVMGEIHPQILENWGITMPCACAEIDLDLLL